MRATTTIVISRVLTAITTADVFIAPILSMHNNYNIFRSVITRGRLKMQDNTLTDTKLQGRTLLRERTSLTDIIVRTLQNRTVTDKKALPE